ncbi:hypothetical protein [Roseixanthobacter liquoris]|uniref:hypothetical protein n=1 Tax=Roseixanthobacter liquoris TaxID=3119921 RepID=UPI003727CF0C
MDVKLRLVGFTTVFCTAFCVSHRGRRQRPAAFRLPTPPCFIKLPRFPRLRGPARRSRAAPALSEVRPERTFKMTGQPEHSAARISRSEDDRARRRPAFAARLIAGVRAHPRLACAVAILAVILAQRLFLAITLGAALDQSAEANPSRVTMQLMRRDGFRFEFLKTLWYLQQTPPLPHVIFGAIVTLAEWPAGVARWLYVVQAAIGSASAVVLFLLMARLRCGLLVSAGMALVFGCSTDLLVMEVHAFGQLFYETLGMLLTLLASYFACVAFDTPAAGRGSRSFILLAGLYTALAILTRSSLSFISLPIAAVLAWNRGLRAMLVFLAPVILLQGGWALKTYAVYGYLSPTASTWGGISIMHGLFQTDADVKRFTDAVAKPGSPSAEWFVRVMQEKGVVEWVPPVVLSFVPDAVRQRQARIDADLRGTNRAVNSIAIQMLSVEYLKAIGANLDILGPLLVNKFLRAYRIYWEPILGYGAFVGGPLFLEPPLASIADLTFDWRPQTPWLNTGTLQNHILSPIFLPAIRLLPFDTVFFFILHFVTPLALVADLALRWRRRPGIFDAKLMVLLAVVTYGAIFFNAVEVNENMRFRIAVEPEIIAFSLGLIAALGARVRRARGLMARDTALPSAAHGATSPLSPETAAVTPA